MPQVGDVYTDHNLRWGAAEYAPEGDVSGTIGYRPTFVVRGDGGVKS